MEARGATEERAGKGRSKYWGPLAKSQPPPDSPENAGTCQSPGSLCCLEVTRGQAVSDQLQEWKGGHTNHPVFGGALCVSLKHLWEPQAVLRGLRLLASCLPGWCPEVSRVSQGNP